MESANRWYFSKEILENTPTRKCGIEASKELSYRQQAANFIQDMGQRLQVTQLCINTAIVYMHRFYMFHSFTKLHRNQLAVAALFLAAKVEEQPRKLEHVVRVAHKCLHRGEDLDPKSEAFATKCSELVSQENMMLQTLGFDIAIDHPHTYVVKLLQLVKASKDLAQTSYFMATNSLHLTTMCLQYRPTVVACVCIHLACKWSNWKIEPCSEGKEWYYYVDKSVTPELLEELTKDFLAVLEKSPNRLKRRVGPENNKDGQTSQSKSSEEIVGRVEAQIYDICIEPMKKDSSPVASTSINFDNLIKDEPPDRISLEIPFELVEPPPPSAALKKPKVETPHSITLAVYREKQEKKQLSNKLLEHKSSSLVSTTEYPPTVTLPVSTPKPVISEKLLVPKLEKPNIPEKLIISNLESRVPSKPLVTSNELVPQKIPDKSNHKTVASILESNVCIDNKVNHLIPKAMVAPMPQVNHHSSKMPVNESVLKVHSKMDMSKGVSESSKSKDPYVLLTRVDQTSVEKKVIPQDIKQHTSLPVNISSKGVPLSSGDELRNKPSRHETPVVPPPLTNWGKDLKNTEGLSSVKQKSKVSLLQNNHNDALHSTQGNIAKYSPAWDSIKANGSKTTEQLDSTLTYSVDINKSTEKIVEPPSKHDRREKHKHKHSVHLNKDKISNHVDSVPDHPISQSGLKITIPKEKLKLGDIRSDSSSNMETTRIKIKLPKPPVSESAPLISSKTNSTGPIKLVLKKDTNAGSYSTTLHKSERSSRKRDRSPSSKVHNSRSSGKSAKMPKTEIVTTTPLMPDTNNTAHLNSIKQTNLDVVYNNLAQQPYNHIPYNTQSYYQSYCPYPTAPTNNMAYSYPLLPPPPPPNILTANSAPPLPRDPPPPLPPQPPMAPE